MSKNKIDIYLAGLYSETQTRVYEDALHLIEALGDSDAKAIASEALTIAGLLEKASLPILSAPVKGSSKPKRKKSAKKTTAKKTTAKKTTVKKATSKKAPKETVTVEVENLNGASSNRLLDWRKSESLSQKDAAAKAEVSISSWQAWESGKWQPGDEMMRRLEKVGI